VSYDLAVWEGDRPSTDGEAAKVFDQLYDELIETDTATPPSPAIEDYVGALLARWPDIGTDGGVDSPWATSSLIKNARGRLIYFAMTRSTDPRVVGEVAGFATERGLVCFDPQKGTLL